MSLASILVRVHDGTSGHVRLTIFAGPDRQHRASCGTLVAWPDEADTIITAFAGAGHEIEHSTPPTERGEESGQRTAREAGARAAGKADPTPRPAGGSSW